ncbi:MAG: cupin domain-containing protein [Gemmatimonadota bacterium]|nr:cupin domain-containing protein [Gemmatimonadota bacterium]
MFIETPRYTIRSLNSNRTYWEQDVFPDWTALNCYRHYPDGGIGTGVEPHYHDNDELWLFTTGLGEVRLDGVRHEITPNTLVYTPMGCVHQFQMFTSYENNAIVTRLERAGRPLHLTVEEYGAPEPTVPGFIVPGGMNTGPIRDPGPRCPISEWRLQRYEEVNAQEDNQHDAVLNRNEHWMVLSGAVQLSLGGREVSLEPGDIALIRAGTTRRLSAEDLSTRVVVAREHPVDAA